MLHPLDSLASGLGGQDIVNHDEVFRTKAMEYNDLVSKEDWNGNLLKELFSAVCIPGSIIVELGAGTGRLTLPLAKACKHITAFDKSESMLNILRQELSSSGCINWKAVIADHRVIPLVDENADHAIAAWTLSYLLPSNSKDGLSEVKKGIREMFRVVSPGGSVIIIESLGTGCSIPTIPYGLNRYFRFLDRLGFVLTTVITDFKFENSLEASRLSQLLFGKSIIDKIIVQKRGFFLPEFTGIWLKKKPLRQSTLNSDSL